MLSAYTRTNSEDGRPVQLTDGEWRKEADRFAAMTIRQKADQLLRYIARKSKFLSDQVEIDRMADVPCAIGTFPAELDFVAKYLEDEDLLAGHERPFDHPAFSVTPKGWQLLEGLGRDQIVRDSVFVARSFDPDLSVVEEGIHRGIVGAGCRTNDLGESREPTNITNQILADISKSEFVVADLTGERPNVYFEVGYALALGRPVILTCRKAQPGADEDASTVHFDIAPYRRIEWSDADELCREVTATLEWLKGRRPPSA